MFDGQSVDRRPPYERNIGMVFQNYALFPHMTVEENVAFPLSVRKISKADVTARVQKALDMIQLRKFGDRRPGAAFGWAAAARCAGASLGVRTEPRSHGRAAWSA